MVAGCQEVETPASYSLGRWFESLCCPATEFVKLRVVDVLAKALLDLYISIRPFISPLEWTENYAEVWMSGNVSSSSQATSKYRRTMEHTHNTTLTFAGLKFVGE